MVYFSSNSMTSTLIICLVWYGGGEAVSLRNSDVSKVPTLFLRYKTDALYWEPEHQHRTRYPGSVSCGFFSGISSKEETDMALP
jgi:hypothetical protein